MDEPISMNLIEPQKPISVPDQAHTPPSTQASGESDVPDMEAIFVEYLSNLDTQPLPKIARRDPRERHVLICLYLMVASALAVCLWTLLTYPTVTVTLIPVEQARTLTTSLAVPLRSLVRVMLTRSLTAPTTGTGQQAAKAAHGILTFYNGTLNAQPVAQGTIVTGRNGVQIVTAQAAVIPPANPPAFGQVTVTALALQTGTNGNIQAGNINQACCGTSIIVKNLSPFTGGMDAHTYRAVAQRDLNTIIARLKVVLSQQVSSAFPLHPGEAVAITGEAFTVTADHRVGEEASAVTVQVTLTGRGVAYDTQTLLTVATRALQAQSSPGSQYHLLATTVQVSIVSVSPLRVTCRGRWVYTLTEAQLQTYAQEIAGKSAQQAQAILLQTDVLTQVTVAQALPKDPAHIRFRVLVSE